MKQYLSAALAACAMLASGLAGADATPLATTTTFVGNSTTSFSCSGIGLCHYLLLNSLCQERMRDKGIKERSCSYTEAARFTLAPGVTKTVANLPADYLYAMKMNMYPSADEVIRAPVPH